MNMNLIVELTTNREVNKKNEIALRVCLSEISQLFKGPPPVGERPIVVFHESIPQPYTNSHSNISIYKIVLNDNVWQLRYNQMIYQFAHEMCHVFTDPRRTNWFVESCCEMMSLKMLDRMSRVWERKVPFSDKVTYAPKFKSYAQKRIQGVNIQLLGKENPEAEEQKSWLNKVKPTLATNPIDRERNTIIATLLLPVFDQSADNWDALRFLGKASIPSPIDLMDFRKNSEFQFALWLRAVPPERKSLVSSISSLFQISSEQGVEK